MKKMIALILGSIMILGLLAGCGSTKTEPAVSEDPVTLTVVGPWEDCTAVEVIGREFNKEYPNCTVQYEYLQNFQENLPARLADNNHIDLFFASAIDELKQYLVDLKSVEGLDLSDTFEGLIENATIIEEDVGRLYSIPLGAEMRGMYVNTTLLDSLGIAVPTNQAELLDACAKLKDKGYIPMNANPGTFAQHLLYPWICNIVANADNYDEVYAEVDTRSDGVSELFREPFEFLYTLVENGYYDYKYVENEYGLFKDASDDATARDFLNIKASGDEYAFEAGNGQVAFMTGALSLRSVMEKVKSDYHSTIEYEFIPAPVGKDGGFVYLSPARTIAANKNSDNAEWSIRFLDFLFTPENNEIFAEAFNIVPNTKDAFSYISSLYTVPESRISEVGQVTFSYGFYAIVKEVLIDLSKANNPYSKEDDGTPKYMIADDNGKFTDEDGNKFSMNTFDHYMSELETSLKGE